MRVYASGSSSLEAFVDTISPTVTGKKSSSEVIEPEWVSPRHFGEIFGISRPVIYRLIAEGKIDARKFGPFKTVINVASGNAYYDSLPKVKASVPKPRRRKPDPQPLEAAE
jgi:hypothetical protein